MSTVHRSKVRWHTAQRLLGTRVIAMSPVAYLYCSRRMWSEEKR
jgi:hypothetical protein